MTLPTALDVYVRYFAGEDVPNALLERAYRCIVKYHDREGVSVANHTDTERLDWLLSHHGAEIDYDGKHCWIRWFSESHWYVVKLPYNNLFRTYHNHYRDVRDLIDAAIDGKAERVA